MITPERVNQIFGQPTQTPAIGREAPDYKRITSRDSAISVDVPESWLVYPSQFDLASGPADDVGSALFAGTRLSDVIDLNEDTLYLGASATTARRLKLVGASDDALLDWASDEAATYDWTVDGCVLSNEAVPQIEGWISAGRLWVDCRDLAGTRMVEFAAVSADGSLIVTAQLALSPNAPEELVHDLLTSIAIAPEKLPTAN